MASLHMTMGNKLLPSTDKNILRIFNLPAVALKQEDGGKIICCEAPDTCKRVCYAKRDQRYTKVYSNRKENYELSLKDDFAQIMIDNIKLVLHEYENSDVKVVYRIHESGDFYSEEYLDKWVEIANTFIGNDKVIL